MSDLKNEFYVIQEKKKRKEAIFCSLIIITALALAVGYMIVNIVSYQNISLKYETEDGEQILCKGSGDDYLYTISYKATGDQVEKVSLRFLEKGMLSNGEKERNFQYDKSLFALKSFETENVKYCLNQKREKEINQNLAYGMEGYLRWYDTENFFGAISSDTEIDFLVKQPMTVQELEEKKVQFYINVLK